MTIWRHVRLNLQLFATADRVPHAVVEQIRFILKVVQSEPHRAGGSALHQIDELRHCLLDPLGNINWHLPHPLNLSELEPRSKAA